MKSTKLIWIIVFAFGGIGLIISAMRGTGSMYVAETTTEYRQVSKEVTGPDDSTTDDKIWIENTPEKMAEKQADGYSVTSAPVETITAFRSADPRQKGEPNIRFNLPSTIGVWIAGFLTLCILSFLYGDNIFYKTAESLIIGASAAYVMVAAFWPMLVEILLGNLLPSVVKAWSNPGIKTETTQFIYIIPLILCVMLLWRLSPKGGWISRWPLAFFIGATAGFRLIAHLESDFTQQIRASLEPLVEIDVNNGFDFWGTMSAITMLVGVIATLVYFFFSVEHKGIVGKTARLGIWFMMITFGAAFGYTVMGRIALLAQRFEFLVDDWLWIIDPTNKRTAANAVTMLMGMGAPF